uniref:Uncharacterized protein n=1 Tax=Ganoderma boninense TaxID=34458 RepID=A0A5K1JZQ2_9APHY|nr:Uncharacterized protein [Ganoderma boninense]
MASQPPATIPPRNDVKGKAKAIDTMIDITNAHADNAQPRSQSLSYFDPAVDEPRPGQADQMETFGLPALLLSGSQPAPTPPYARRGRERVDTVESVRGPDPVVRVALAHAHARHADAPGQRAPAAADPDEAARQATVVLQTRLTTLLGKRPNGDDDDEEADAERDRDKGKDRDKEETVSAKKLKAQNSRLGKRLKPLQRTTSNMSCTDLLNGTPGQSPASTFAAAASPVVPPEPELVPQLPSAKRARPASSSGDEADTSGIGDGATSARRRTRACASRTPTRTRTGSSTA